MMAEARGVVRVIPACAGNSESSEHHVCPPTGHPCVCGEQSPQPAHSSDMTVSSLRVRGTDCAS